MSDTPRADLNDGIRKAMLELSNGCRNAESRRLLRDFINERFSRSLRFLAGR